MMLDFYVRRFHEKALHCYDPMHEEILANICLHGVVDEYRENLSVPFFCKVMDVTRRTNEFIRRSSKPNFVSRLDPVMRPPLQQRGWL